MNLIAIPNHTMKVWVRTLPYADYYSLSDASVIIGQPYGSIYGLCRRGSIKSFQVNGQLALSHETVCYLRNRHKRAIEKLSAPIHITVPESGS